MISYAKISFSRKKKKIRKTSGKFLKLLQLFFDKAEIFQQKTRILYQFPEISVIDIFYYFLLISHSF